MAMKIDLEKAYDKLDWGFLDEVLRCFGFSSLLRQLIHQCVCTVSFSVLLNGSPYVFSNHPRASGKTTGSCLFYSSLLWMLSPVW